MRVGIRSRGATVVAPFAVLLGCAGGSADGTGGAVATDAVTREHGGFPVPVLTRPDLQRLVEAGLDRSSAVLIDALADPDPAVRATAAYALASVQAVTAGPHLAALLGDPDATVRRNAAFAIGQLGEAAGADALIAALNTEADPAVRLTLLEAVGKTGDAAALARLLAVVAPSRTESGTHVSIDLGGRSAHDDAEGLALALYHFARRGVSDSAAAPVLLALLRADDERTRSAAALALTAPRPEWGATIDDLRAGLDSLPADARAAGPLLRALARSADPSHLPRLLSGLAAADWTVRAAAAAALGEYEAAVASPEAVAALLAALDDASPHVATVAAGSLLALHARAGRPAGTADGLDPDVWLEWIRAHPERSAVAAALLPGLVGTAHESFVLEWASGGAAPRVARLAWPALARSDAARADTILLAGLTGARRDSYVAAAVLAERLALRPTDARLRSRLARLLSHRLAAWGPHAPTSDVRGALRLVQRLAGAAPADAAALIAAARQHPHPQIRAAGGAPPSADARPPARRPVNWSLLASAGPRPCLAFTTARGTFVELYPTLAPLAVSALLEWAEASLYDGLTFHRVEPDFILQSGDFDNPHGYGGPEHGLRSEFTRLRYAPGVLGIASAGKDTEGSQFFITHNYAPSLDGRYGAVGRVIAGREIADAIALGDTLITVSRVAGSARAAGGVPPGCTARES